MKLKEKLETIQKMLEAGISRGKIKEAMAVNASQLSTVATMIGAGYRKRKSRKRRLAQSRYKEI